jgi:hypothetical protein
MTGKNDDVFLDWPREEKVNVIERMDSFIAEVPAGCRAEGTPKISRIPRRSIDSLIFQNGVEYPDTYLSA